MIVQASALPTRHYVSIRDFHRMGEASLFAENDRVELIAGELFDMPPIGSRHSGAVNRLNRLLNLGDWRTGHRGAAKPDHA